MKVPKEKFYDAKRPINIWDVNIDSIIISKLLKIKGGSKYLTEYLDKFIKPLDLILSKMRWYVKTSKCDVKNTWYLSVKMMKSY